MSGKRIKLSIDENINKINIDNLEIPYCYKNKLTNEALKQMDSDFYLKGFIKIFNINRNVCMNYIELTKEKYNWNFYNEALNLFNYNEYNLI